MRGIFPELPLVIVSEFRQPDCEWIPYHIKRRVRENRALITAALAGRKVRLAAVILEPGVPHWSLRLLGFSLAPLYLMAFNENGEHFMLRPRSAATIARHLAWRAKNFVRWQVEPGGWIHKQADRLRHPSKLRLPIYYRLALARGKFVHRREPPALRVTETRTPGISVVIPSRNGGELLDRCLPRVYDADEIIVVDNGSTDGTEQFLRSYFPSVIVEHTAAPLAFSRAANRGIRRARCSRPSTAYPAFLRQLPRFSFPKAAAARKPARPRCRFRAAPPISLSAAKSRWRARTSAMCFTAAAAALCTTRRSSPRWAASTNPTSPPMSRTSIWESGPGSRAGPPFTRRTRGSCICTAPPLRAISLRRNSTARSNGISSGFSPGPPATPPCGATTSCASIWKTKWMRWRSRLASR